MTAQDTFPSISVSQSGATVEPISGRIGAEITGVDISQPLDDSTVEVVRRALDTWKVVFFRGQKLDHASQIAFGRRFGSLTYAHPHDDTPPDGYP
ncbi:MAG TPA: TauD/TfdA family dioxygenase, partial [Acidimicrobiales bacterium]|nr:TauD/TfdA family dioxygenase [Acidimicrobiales bacterium]